MADITFAKAAVRAATAPQTSQLPDQQKKGPSKFDNIRSQLSEQLMPGLKLGPVKQLSGQQAASIETALRKRLTQNVGSTPANLFAPDMKLLRGRLNQVTAAVNQMPQNKNALSIRDSLSSIESQYQQSAGLIGGSKAMDLQSLLQVQSQLYRMGENLDLLSKVVDQVTSGVKTIFQTQVG